MELRATASVVVAKFPLSDGAVKLNCCVQRCVGVWEGDTETVAHPPGGIRILQDKKGAGSVCLGELLAPVSLHETAEGTDARPCSAEVFSTCTSRCFFRPLLLVPGPSH